MNQNFLNLREDQLDKKIFHIFSEKWFFNVFKTNKLTLQRPKKWDDPFENFIMNATGDLGNGNMFSVGFRDNVYGQCWSMTKESDAMWRIYAPQKDGVKVSTTPRKLLKALYEQSGPYKDVNSFLGKVEYKATPVLTKMLNDGKIMRSLLTDTSGKGLAQTLLFKRTAFRHENEVRLIYNSPKKLDSDYFHFTVNPFELFDGVVFDPRMDYDTFKKHKEKLVSMGYKEKIIRSLLYRVPNLRFEFKE